MRESERITLLAHTISVAGSLVVNCLASLTGKRIQVRNGWRANLFHKYPRPAGRSPRLAKSYETEIISSGELQDRGCIVQCYFWRRAVSV